MRIISISHVSPITINKLMDWPEDRYTHDRRTRRIMMKEPEVKIPTMVWSQSGKLEIVASTLTVM